jgi:hypothetical protein
VGSAAASLAAETAQLDKGVGQIAKSRAIEEDLIERARKEDARHWVEHRRPISADTLRKQLRIGAARSRTLVSIIRGDRPEQRIGLVDTVT